jgi:ubiquinone/menaquinone biosynthesis C-methylase UbiE
MFQTFLAETGVQAEDTILDIGATSDRTLSHSNYIEAWYPHKDRITATGIDDASFLEELYPGLRFVRTDAGTLPFPDRSFDYLHSSAVLEHVGSRDNQTRFLNEAWRVARKGVFVTTPNRWFPVELHTVMPFVHWLPPAIFRKLCKMRGLHYFASEDNLNLLSVAQLRGLATEAGMENIKVLSVKLAGWPSNLLLSAKRAI